MASKTAGLGLLGIHGGRRRWHLHPRERCSLANGPAKAREAGPGRGRGHWPSKLSPRTPSPLGKKRTHQLGSLGTLTIREGPDGGTCAPVLSRVHQGGAFRPVRMQIPGMAQDLLSLVSGVGPPDPQGVLMLPCARGCQGHKPLGLFPKHRAAPSVPGPRAVGACYHRKRRSLCARIWEANCAKNGGSQTLSCGSRTGPGVGHAGRLSFLTHVMGSPNSGRTPSRGCESVNSGEARLFPAEQPGRCLRISRKPALRVQK